MKTVLVNSGKSFNSIFAEMKESIDPLLNTDFKRLEEHICGIHATLLLLDEVVPKGKKKPFYQTLHKHPKFMRK